MSSVLGIPSRGEKGKSKYLALDINNLYKGKSLEIQKSTVVPKYGLQTLGKITAGRRMPPPANLPSLKSENCGNNPNINLVPCGGQGWGTNTEENLSSSSSQPLPLPSASSASQKESGVKTWSSVCSSTATPPPTFPKEFPELNAAPDQTTNNNNAPQLSLRPQSSGNWSQGSKPPDPPLNSGNGDKGGTRHGGTRSDAEHGRRENTGSGHPAHHQQPQSDRSKPGPMGLERKKYSQPDHRGQPFSDSQPNAIVCEKDLKVFEELLQESKSSWSTTTHEIDYNARLDFCDDDDEEEDTQTETNLELPPTPTEEPTQTKEPQQPKLLIPPHKEAALSGTHKEVLHKGPIVAGPKMEEVNVAANHSPEIPPVYPNLAWHGGKDTQQNLPTPPATHYDLMRGYAASSTAANWLPAAPPHSAPLRFNAPQRTSTYPPQYPPQQQMVQRLGYEEQLWYGSKQHTSDHMTATVERARMQRYEEERRLEMSKYSSKIEELSTGSGNYNRNIQQHQQYQTRHYNKDVPPRFQKQAEMKHNSAAHHGPMPIAEPLKQEYKDKQVQETPNQMSGYRNLKQQQSHQQKAQPTQNLTSFQDGWNTGRNLPESRTIPPRENIQAKPQANIDHKVNTEVFYKKTSHNEDNKLSEALKPPIIGSFMPRGEMSRFGCGGQVISAPPRAAVCNYGPPPQKPGFGPKKEDEAKPNPRSVAPPIGAIPLVVKQEEKSASPTLETGMFGSHSSAPHFHMSDSNKNHLQSTHGGNKDSNKPYSDRPNGHELQQSKGGDALPPRFQRRYSSQQQQQNYHHNQGRGGRPNRQPSHREGGDFYKDKEDKSKEESGSHKSSLQKNPYRTGGGGGGGGSNNGENSNNRRSHRGYQRGPKGGGGNRDDPSSKTDEDGQVHHVRRQMEKVSLHNPVGKQNFPSGSDGHDSADFSQDASNSNNNKPNRGGPLGSAGKKPPRKDGKTGAGSSSSGGGGGGGSGGREGGGGNGNRYREKKLPPRFAKQKELEKMKVTGDNNAGSC